MNDLYTIFVLLAISSVSVCSPDCCTTTSIEEEVHVSCRGCGLHSVPEDLPLKTTVLDLTNNRINILNARAYLHLRQLKTLTLTSNGLSNISPDAFRSLHNLRYLDLSDNALNGSIDRSVFQSLANLSVLYMEKNFFYVNRDYPEDALSTLWNLETLHIDIFEGFYFGNGFEKMTKLRNIKFNRNGRDAISIRNNSFMGLGRSNITHLEFDFPIREIEKDSLSPFKKLILLNFNSRRTLYLRTFLQALYGLRNRTMDEIRADGNMLKFDKQVKVTKSDLVYLKTICVKRLYLRSNSIASIEMSAILSWKTRNCLEVINLSYNKIISPEFFMLLSLFPALTHFYASHQYMGPYRRKRRHFIQEMTFFVPSSLIFIDLNHIRMDDDLYTFKFNEGNRLQHVDISYPWAVTCKKGRVMGLVYMTDMYMSGIDCSEPNPQMFADMINLARLEARQCNFGDYMSGHSTLFRGLHNLTFVDLSANNIQTLEPTTFNDQSESLKTLLLSENRLQRLPVPVLESLNVLEMLNMSDNLISGLTETEYSFLDRIQAKSGNFKINLNGNPLVCNCDNLDFLRWIYTSSLIHHKKKLLCLTSNGSRDQLGNIFENFEDLQENCVAFSWLIVSVVLIFISFMAVTLAFVSWRYSPRIRVWCRHPLECERTHMVFLSYSSDDSSFARKVCDTLENDGISCWCYDRDFTPGVDIAENIMDAIDSCHKSVFVVSYSLIHSEWLQFAMQVASRYSLRDRRESDNIVILLNDIRLSEMPKLLRKIWDQVVCIKWPNENSTDTSEISAVTETFWKKLSKKVGKGIQRTDGEQKETSL